jgi:hypothetical protein
MNKSQFYCLLAGILGIICTVNDELVSKLLDSEH